MAPKMFYSFRGFHGLIGETVIFLVLGEAVKVALVSQDQEIWCFLGRSAENKLLTYKNEVQKNGKSSNFER